MKVLLALLSVALPTALAQQTVYLDAQDGVRVYGDFYEKTSPAGAIVLVNGAYLSPDVPFSRRCEFTTLPETLQEKGYAVLNIDLRPSGWENLCQNRTKAPVGDTHDSVQDLEAAVRWMQQKTGQQKVILLGSGYGSMVSLYYALNHPEHIRGVATLSLRSSNIFMTDELAHGLNRFTVPLTLVSPQDEAGLSQAIVAGLKPGQARLVVAPPMQGYTLGFNDPATYAVYERSTLEFLESLKP